MGLYIIMHLLLVYFFYRNTRLDKGLWLKVIGLLSIVSCGVLIEGLVYFKVMPSYGLALILGIEVLIVFIYLIFYNNDVLTHQLSWYIPLQISYVLAVAVVSETLVLAFCLLGLWLTSLVQSKINVFMVVILTLVTLCSLMLGGLMVVPILLAFDGMLFYRSAENSRSIEMMQRKYLSHQYDEIKNVYLNMRGWRHDYHNHIQAMKAYISMDAYEGLEVYLNTLEHELESVDTLVQSGHIMMDAILNSKITLMLSHNIGVNFKAVLPQTLPIKDLDLCIIVSNLLDNAIESCLEVKEDARSIRIFSEVHGSQFYLSIQNSAVDHLNFNQKHYISSKRGHHGLGVKRVSFITEKYEGYLNLQNEAGIFASEVTIPV